MATSLRLTPELAAKIKELALKHHRSEHGELLHAVATYAEAHDTKSVDEVAMKLYYVYTLLYPDGTIFYVGKGAGNRIHTHLTEARRGGKGRKCEIIRDIWGKGGEVLEQKVAFFDTDEEARAFEKCLIAFFGRENLANATNGGESRPSQGRNVRLQITVTPEIDGWLDAQWGASDKSKSDIVFRLLNKMREKSEIMTNTFLASEDFKAGVIAATKASFGGSGYSVELFPDATWRVLWNNQIGNKYGTPGKIIGLPPLSTDDMQQCLDDGMSEEEYYDLAFENQREEIEAVLKASLAQNN